MSDSIPGGLDRFLEAGVLEPLDLRFGLTLARLAGAPGDLRLALAAALACRAPRLGHVFADLRDLRSIRIESPPDVSEPALPWPEPERWIEALATSPLVTGPPPTPLVLDGGRLYLRRYWDYQERLGRGLLERASDEREIDLPSCRETLAQLFPPNEKTPEPDRQRIAAAVAVLRGLAVMTGGPGTGKTTTVVRLIGLLVDQARREGRDLRVALAAPTGKAAARLSQSIREGKGSAQILGLPPEVIRRIPEEATTIHRLLGFQSRRPTRFRHDGLNPLPLDVVVVDEASMIPLALMAKLVDAVPAAARLILLGDRDQLASVEAGAVLGDICPETSHGHFGAAFASRLRDLGVDLPSELSDAGVDAGGSSLGDCIVSLTHSYRFDRRGGIGKLAEEVNAGRGGEAIALLRGAAGGGPGSGQLAYEGSDDLQTIRGRVKRLVLEHHRAVVPGTSEQEALGSIARFCVLCAHRRGPLGAARLNADIEGWLTAAGRIDGRGEWYSGRPVMVTQNDYGVGLFNGDIGVTLPAKGRSGALRVVFPSTEEPGYRELAPGRLPPHETVYAMTVHKSQGSEFERVVLVLPSGPSRILTRELLYTGLTRAREHITIVGASRVIAAGVRERVQRASGLREILWEGGSS